MPTYQYACTDPETRHEFEVVQSFTDPAVAVCPECGAPVRKVYGSVGVVFKGSGFYRNDSRPAPGDGTPKESGDAASPKDGATPAAAKDAPAAPSAPSKPSTPAAGDTPAVGTAKPAKPGKASSTAETAA